MGHRYLGIISADGASGGPQMRLGGRIEGSLIIEGYWFSATSSNQPSTPGSSAAARPGSRPWCGTTCSSSTPTPRRGTPTRRSGDPSGAAQPGWGYTLQGASFGALVEGNIISQAMLIDELGVAEGSRGFGIRLTTKPDTYEDGKSYAQQNNTIRGNIVYRTGDGLQIAGDWTGVKGNVVEDNVFVARKRRSPVRRRQRRCGRRASPCATTGSTATASLPAASPAAQAMRPPPMPRPRRPSAGPTRTAR